jgi:tetratricopeptide (TPR) repeat protein
MKRRLAAILAAQTSGHLWVERYDRDLTDIFAVQDEVTADIVNALFELGWYLHYAGRADESLSYFDRAVRLDPNHADLFLHFMAQAYFQLARYDETVNLLHRRLVRSPNSNSSRMLLAACYGYLGKLDDARKVWHELKEIHPTFTIEQRRKVLPYKYPEDFQKIVTGLSKSGIEPETEGGQAWVKKGIH